MMNNKFRRGLLGLKDFKMILRVTAAQRSGAVHKELGDRMERAASTSSSLEAEQDSVKANTVNGERQLQALVDKKRVIITESSIRSDLHLEDAGGIGCLPTATIFEELARMGHEKPSQRLTFYKLSFLHNGTTQDKGIDSGIPTDSQQTPITAQPSSSRPQKKQSRRKQRKEIEVPQDETHHDDSVPIPSNHPLLSDEDRIKGDCWFKEEGPKVGKKKEIKNYKGRIKIVDETQGRLDDAEMFDTDDLHCDEVILDMAVGEKQEKSAKIDEREVSTGVEDSANPTIPVTTSDEGVTATKIDEITPTSAPTKVIDELTLAQTLIKIKAAKPKAVTTAATTTTTRPKVRGVVVQDPSEFRTTTSSPQASQPLKTKDKGKAIMIKPKVPLKSKDQVALDEEMLKGRSYDEIQKLFDKEMKRVNSFVAMNSEAQEISGKKNESGSKKTEIAQDSSAKRAGDKLEYNESKKQKTDENEEVEEDNEAELKKHLVIVKDDDIAIDAIPLATKPLVIVEYKLIKEGIIGHYQLIRADGSSKRYSSMNRML
ncbi:hypothetical protein Tco_0161765 [Tanacetum coccineum]